MENISNARPLRFVQIGDLHATDHGLQNHRDFLRIVDELNDNVGGKIDFVYLPGDNADDGTSEQFALVRDGLKRLRLPWRAIPGDHDFKPRSLTRFYDGLYVPKLPFAEEIKGCVCLFLDVVSQGTGGPDFRLGQQQFTWLKFRLAAAKQEGKTCVVLMHAYPADLGDEAEELTRVLDESNTLLVAMGHTHYNEISHDGRTVYAATRSTGQIEEGPVGLAFMAVDGNAVSWRFKPLESPWPFVMITSPADRRLSIHGDGQPTPAEVRATVWGAATTAHADLRIDDGPWLRMSSIEGGQFNAPLRSDTPCRLEVRATDQNGSQERDVIEWDPDGNRDRASSGSDTNSIGAWPERHLFGTQLGPNRNGRKW
ncbi:metallophosphoesterase [Bradyrhizobium sp. UFLA03-84]|uniref:metallophosphoesterase family protein n=1 Tax=Bradyrhizobium sp. UFLA03-84 TaxID=418599 RepID=UPI000BAE55ED|nr:metallophosphoesterase [Bradyrhizobium sp. UFLA03-84]PAY09535.1 metallophosphoesterase [Bradyrhizobium sp. UFLA03-84]